MNPKTLDQLLEGIDASMEAVKSFNDAMEVEIEPTHTPETVTLVRGETTLIEKGCPSGDLELVAHRRIFLAREAGTTRFLGYKNDTFFRTFPVPDPKGYLPAEFASKEDAERASMLAWPRGLAWETEEACARSCPACLAGFKAP